MDSANIKNKIMNREDIQEEFRQQTQEPITTLNKCEVGTNPKYVIWLEKRILALSIPHVSKSVVCDCLIPTTTMELPHRCVLCNKGIKIYKNE